MSLITSIDQVKGFSSINVSNTLAVWQPYLDEAEETFIKPVIGETLIAELDEYIEGSTEDAELEALLEKVRKPLVLYALYLGADEMAISVSAAGIQVVTTETHKPAAQYQVQNLKESWMRRAHVAMDVLLSYLEENKTTFTSYDSHYNDYFLRSAAEFQEHQDIRSSRRVYIQLLPIIKSIEKKYIRPTLSEAYFNELKEALQGSTALSEDDQAIVDLIGPALAHLAMARALQEISIDILDWGIFATAVSTFDNVVVKQSANADKIAMMVKACQQDGEAELKELQEYLDTNATAEKYATYYASSRRYDPDTEDVETRGEFINDTNNGIFVV